MPSAQDILQINDILLRAHPLKYLTYEPGPTKLRNVERKAMIACTARSGSSLLTVQLRKYFLLFDEYLNTESLVKEIAQKGISTTKAYGDYLAEHFVSGGLLGIKVPTSGLLYLLLLEEFPSQIQNWKVIFLKRENFIRQAISMYIATSTNQWTSVMNAVRQLQEEDYNFDLIKAHAEAAVHANGKWERLFCFFGVVPHRVSYETLTADPEKTLREVTDFLGVDRSKQDSNYQQYLEIQSTELNRRWEERFLEDMMRYASRFEVPVELSLQNV